MRQRLLTWLRKPGSPVSAEEDVAIYDDKVDGQDDRQSADRDGDSTDRYPAE
jgi:hypothetical protein